jgi:hypothetical protein
VTSKRCHKSELWQSRREQDGGDAGLGLSIGSWIASAQWRQAGTDALDHEGSVFTAILPQTPVTKLIDEIAVDASAILESEPAGVLPKGSLTFGKAS